MFPPLKLSVSGSKVTASPLRLHLPSLLVSLDNNIKDSLEPNTLKVRGDMHGQPAVSMKRAPGTTALGEKERHAHGRTCMSPRLDSLGSPGAPPPFSPHSYREERSDSLIGKRSGRHPQTKMYTRKNHSHSSHIRWTTKVD